MAATKHTRTAVCPYCEGLGSCSLCSGRGARVFVRGSMGRRTLRTCRACDGSGDCQLCAGEGGLRPCPTPPREREAGEPRRGKTFPAATTTGDGRGRNPTAPRERLAAVLAVLRENLTPREASQRYGASVSDLATWTYRFMEGGEMALEPGSPVGQSLEHRLGELRTAVSRLTEELESFGDALPAPPEEPSEEPARPPRIPPLVSRRHRSVATAPTDHEGELLPSGRFPRLHRGGRGLREPEEPQDS